MLLGSWPLLGSYLAFWPFGPSFPFILAFWAFISFHFGLLGFHFLSFWPFRPLFPVILAFWACISFHFGLLGLHFLAFWLCGLHFLAFWPFRGQLLGPIPQVAKNGPFAQRPYNGFISARTGSILQFLAFWAFISLHFGLVGLHFLAFWLCGPSFPCILALWAFISLHFGLWGLYFLAFWLCGPSFPCILALWAFISLHFGLVGLHFLAFWPRGPSFPCIFAFSGSASGPPPQVAKNGPFAQRPYNGFIRAVTSSILQFLAFWAFISLHFGLVGLHFLAFWPCGSSFPCVLAFWAFISFHFGLVGLHFLAFWPFRGQLLGPPHKLPKMARLPNVLTMDLAAPWPAPFCSFLTFWAFISLHFGLVGLHFLAFWPCGPSFPCILALWAFISLHFGLVGLHFLAFWPCWPSLPFILAFSGSASGVLPASFQKWPVCPTSLQWIYQCPDRLHFAVSSLLLWPCADAVAGTSCCFKWRSASPSRGAWDTPCAKSNLFLWRFVGDCSCWLLLLWWLLLLLLLLVVVVVVVVVGCKLAVS